MAEMMEGSEEAEINAYASPEAPGLVVIAISCLSPGGGKSWSSMLLEPEIAYEFAQRVTLAAMAVENTTKESGGGGHA